MFNSLGGFLKFATLYKKTNTGAIQFWKIEVLTGHPQGAQIYTEFGQLGTDKPQSTTDLITKGKNIGKKNETNPLQQAQLEAKSKWDKQKKKGYVETVEAAQNEEVDSLIEGGIVPMLAHKFSEQAHKIVYPAFIQPKLDGVRCIAVISNGVAKLWTRTRKQITSVPHITKELEDKFANQNLILDGELYNHDMKANFEKIVSLVRQEEPDDDHKLIQYHVYDIANTESFEVRHNYLKAIFSDYNSTYLKLVNTDIVKLEDDVMEFFDNYRALGYEGAMLRNSNSIYENKRSYNLLKVKEFDDAEFKIVGIEEGRGKLAGHVGSFVCETSDGKRFLAKAKGSLDRLKEYFNFHSLWKDKKLTVQFQGITKKEEVPRFPVGIAIRDYE